MWRLIYAPGGSWGNKPGGSRSGAGVAEGLRGTAATSSAELGTPDHGWVQEWGPGRSARGRNAMHTAVRGAHVVPGAGWDPLGLDRVMSEPQREPKSPPFSPSPNNTSRGGFSNRLGQDPTSPPVPFQAGWPSLGKHRSAPSKPSTLGKAPRAEERPRPPRAGTCPLPLRVPDPDCTPWHPCDRSIPPAGGYTACACRAVTPRTPRGEVAGTCDATGVPGAPTACGTAQHPRRAPGLPAATPTPRSPSLQ